MHLFMAVLLCVLVSVGAAAMDQERLTIWAKQLEKDVAEGKGEEALKAALDYDRLIAKALHVMDLSQDQRKEITAGAKRGGNKFPSQIADEIRAGGSYRFRRVLVRPDGLRPLFRLCSDKSGTNWHEMMMAEDANGALRIIDIHLYTTGELMSTTIRDAIASLNGQESGFFAKLIGEDGAAKATQQLVDLKKDFDAGKWPGVLKRSRQLPEGVRNQKAVWLMRIMAAEKLGETRHAQELDAFAQAYPNDSAQLLISIDAHILGKRFPQAYAAIDALEKTLGIDAQLDIMRANIALTQGDQALAKRCAGDATVHEADWTDTWYTRMGVALAAKDHADIVICLDALSGLGVTFKDLTTLPNFADFVASPEYQGWRKRNPPTP